MFGYVLVNPQTLEEGEKQRFRACYCGLCRALKARYGDAGRLTLSNDMTFLSMLLSALYEPEETQDALRPAASPEKAPVHAKRRHGLCGGHEHPAGLL